MARRDRARKGLMAGGGAAAGEPRLLVVGPAWIGDMVIAHSLFRLLRQVHPGARLDVVAPPATRPLLDFMPEVGQAYEVAGPQGRGAQGARRGLGRRRAGGRNP